MSVSALFTPKFAIPPISSGYGAFPTKTLSPRLGGGGGGGGGLVIDCSSRPKKKATAHHKKTRPRKSQPWDIKRKPTVYAPLPPMPPEWTLVTGDDFPSLTTPTTVTTPTVLESVSEQ